MAIDKQTAPLDYPLSSDDWQRLIDITDTLALSFKNPWPVSGTNIICGSVFYIGGTWYVANVDVAITGTLSDYIKLTVDIVNNRVDASFVATLVDVTWNKQWNGWYDPSGAFYVFDENLAYGAGLIDYPRTVVYSRPKNAESARAASVEFGDNWANFLSHAVDPTDNANVSVTVPNTLYPQFNKTSRKEAAGAMYLDDNWYTLGTIRFTNSNIKATLKSFRYLWQNETPDGDNFCRLIDESDNVVVAWNDLTANGVLQTITGLNVTDNTTYRIQYKAYSFPSTVGARAFTVYSSLCDDIDKPNLLETLALIAGTGIE